MLRGLIHNIITRHGLGRCVTTMLSAAIVVMLAVIILQLALPVSVSSIKVGDTSRSHNVSARSIVTRPHEDRPLVKVMRRGLFKPATPLADKPLADKTIQKIKSQLKLQCIMEMTGTPVAYINIKGMGLRQCKVGDSISDLFTLASINKNSVDVTIIGHKVTLGL